MMNALVEVTRGGQIESIHRGHIVVVDSRGAVRCQYGDANFNFCLRSCAKPLQALPVITSGAADAYQITPRELAVMSGSLSGQDFHIAAIGSILDKIGLDQAYLKCGVHRPSHRPTARRLQERGEKPTSLHNNCAGKHAAMLTLCVHHGWPLDSYLESGHPVQQMMLSTVSSLTGVPVREIGTGTDGCGVPVFFLPLSFLARSYARLAAVSDPAIHRLMNAVLSYPEMIAGDERICTNVMRALGRKVFAKTGAEGGYAMSLMEKKWGVAIKIEDGNNRALYPVIIETLKQLQVLTGEEEEVLSPYHRPVVKNHRGEVVGEIAARFSLGAPRKKVEK